MAFDPVTATQVAVAFARTTKDHWPKILTGIVTFVIVAMIMVMIPMMVAIGIMSAIADPAVAKRVRGGVPQSNPFDAKMINEYRPIYIAAASHFGVNWYLLAAIHKKESTFTTGTARGIKDGINAYRCCAGPMQFNVTNGPPSTWDNHKDAFKEIQKSRPRRYPQMREPHPSIYDDFDAIAAAAHKLKADGADESLYSDGTRQAVCSYIGACSHVDNCGGPNEYCQVLPWAQAWELEGMAAELPDDVPPPERIGSAAFPMSPRGRITTHFGAVDGLHPNPHAGLDLAHGDAVIRAFHAGTVSVVQLPGNVTAGYGNYVCIDHPTLNLASCYAHLRTSSVIVRRGDRVRPGDPIAAEGSTGHSTGPHLHFELRSRTPDQRTGRYRFFCPAEYLGLRYADACDRRSI